MWQLPRAHFPDKSDKQFQPFDVEVTYKEQGKKLIIENLDSQESSHDFLLPAPKILNPPLHVLYKAAWSDRLYAIEVCTNVANLDRAADSDTVLTYQVSSVQLVIDMELEALNKAHLRPVVPKRLCLAVLEIS